MPTSVVQGTGAVDLRVLVVGDVDSEYLLGYLGGVSWRGILAG